MDYYTIVRNCHVFYLDSIQVQPPLI